MAPPTPARRQWSNIFCSLKKSILCRWNFHETLPRTHRSKMKNAVISPSPSRSRREFPPLFHPKNEQKECYSIHTYTRASPHFRLPIWNSTLYTSDPDFNESPWTHMKLRDATRCQNKGILWIEESAFFRHGTKLLSAQECLRSIACFSLMLVRREQGNLIAKLIFLRWKKSLELAR